LAVRAKLNSAWLSRYPSIPSNSNPPNYGTSSVFYFSIGGKRYELRTTVEAREITGGPAEVIEISSLDRSEERPPTQKLR
jgi:hypothetical protein